MKESTKNWYVWIMCTVAFILLGVGFSRHLVEDHEQKPRRPEIISGAIYDNLGTQQTTD